MVTELFNYTGTTPNVDQAGGFQLGNNFTVSAETVVGHAFWYKLAAYAGNPTSVKLWNATAGTLLASVTDRTSVNGWNVAALSATVTLEPGTTYQIAVSCLGSDTFRLSFWSTAPPAIDSPFTVTGCRYLNNDGGPATNGSTAELIAVGVGTGSGGTPDGGTGGSTGVGDPTYTGDLAAWLSSDTTTQLHETDGLPWLSKVAIDAIEVVTDKLGHSGSGNSLDWITSLWRLAGDLTDAEIGLLKSLLDKQSQVVGGSGGGGSAFYGPSGTQVAEGVETLLAQGVTPTDLGAAIALLRERLDLSPDLADTTRWTLVDTIDGSADALVNVQADAYFFNLTTIPSSHPHLGVAATLWVPRWGWVAPRVHAHFRQRQFSDVFPAVFTADGLFMDGVLIHALPGFEWTCECYTLDRS